MSSDLLRRRQLVRKLSPTEPCDDAELAHNGSPRIGSRDRLLERLQRKHREGGDRPSPATKRPKP